MQRGRRRKNLKMSLKSGDGHPLSKPYSKENIKNKNHTKMEKEKILGNLRLLVLKRKEKQ